MSAYSPIFVIAGPTASGKTALGVAVAKAVGGEVVNFDSVQIYKEIEIATAKPSLEEMQGIPHHLIGYVDPRVNYTAADWARDAAAKIEEIEARGTVPVLVGGTGFYLRTLMQPLFESPPTDPDLRRRFQNIKETKGSEYLHRILARVDPEVSRNLFPRDYVRIIRALEVYFQTGERLSVRQQERGTASDLNKKISVFVLEPPRDELYALIDRRTETHFSNGLLDEVKRLRAAGVQDSTNALGSHGYRRICEYLRGERSFESALERTKQDVRNYAKRQLTWFRGDEDVHRLAGFGTNGRFVDEILHLGLEKA